MQRKMHQDGWDEEVSNLCLELVDEGRREDPLMKKGCYDGQVAIFIATFAIQFIHDIARKLDISLPDGISKSLDVAAYDAMGELADRLDRIESSLREIDETRFKFRGYWRTGSVAKRGDAFTNDGSLWCALCDTNEPPGHGSPDWQLAARKGRDGR